MLGLIYKDLRSMPMIFMTLIMSLIGSGACILDIASDEVAVGSDAYTMLYGFFSFMGFFLIFCGFDAAVQQIFLPDEKLVRKHFYVSSPAGVKGYITEKYVLTLMLSVVMLGIMLTANLISVKLNSERTDLTGVILLLFDFLLVQSAISLPVTARFGSKAGDVYRSCVFFALIFAAVMYLLFGDLSIFGSFDGFIEKFSKLVEKIRNADTLRRYALLIGVPVSITVFAASFRPCCCCFRAGLEKCEE